MNKIFYFALLCAASQSDDSCDASKGLKTSGFGTCECIDSSHWLNDEESACIDFYRERQELAQRLNSDPVARKIPISE